MPGIAPIGAPVGAPVTVPAVRPIGCGHGALPGPSAFLKIGLSLTNVIGKLGKGSVMAGNSHETLHELDERTRYLTPIFGSEAADAPMPVNAP